MEISSRTKQPLRIHQPAALMAPNPQAKIPKTSRAVIVGSFAGDGVSAIAIGVTTPVLLKEVLGARASATGAVCQIKRTANKNAIPRIILDRDT